MCACVRHLSTSWHGKFSGAGWRWMSFVISMWETWQAIACFVWHLCSMHNSCMLLTGWHMKLVIMPSRKAHYYWGQRNPAYQYYAKHRICASWLLYAPIPADFGAGDWSVDRKAKHNKLVHVKAWRCASILKRWGQAMLMQLFHFLRKDSGSQSRTKREWHLGQTLIMSIFGVF